MVLPAFPVFAPSSWLRVVPVAAAVGLVVLGLGPVRSAATGYDGPTVVRGPAIAGQDGPHGSLLVLGPIGADAADRFEAAARRSHPGDVVFVSSPGGLVGQAIAIGRTVRAHGLSVVVGQALQGVRPGRCVSACTFILAGGVARSAVPGSVIGVHAIAPVDGRTADGRDHVEAGLAAYLEEMGISAHLPALMAGHRDVVKLPWGVAAMMGLVNRRPFSSACDSHGCASG